MAALKMGGKAVRSKPLPQMVDPDEPDRIVLFMRLVAMNCEARRDLANAVRRLRKLEAQLADPALMDHPKRPAATRRLPQRQEDERAATTRLMETNVSLERQWHTIPASQKHKFGLTFIVGESDPQANILGALWCEDRGLARLVPFPDGWSPPQDISHRAFDTTIGVIEHDMRKALLDDYPSF